MEIKTCTTDNELISLKWDIWSSEISHGMNNFVINLILMSGDTYKESNLNTCYLMKCDRYEKYRLKRNGLFIDLSFI